jgi:hypothetical protein
MLTGNAVTSPAKMNVNPQASTSGHAVAAGISTFSVVFIVSR